MTQIGGNALVGATVTYSHTPHTSYTAGTVQYLDNTQSDYTTGGAAIITNTPLDIEALYGAYTVWNQSDNTVVTATFNAGAAVGGSLFSAQGFYGASSQTRPDALLLEYSDNGSSWTTVTSISGMTSGTAGAKGWLMQFDISASGGHQYWRLSMTMDGTGLALAAVSIT